MRMNADYVGNGGQGSHCLQSRNGPSRPEKQKNEVPRVEEQKVIIMALMKRADVLVHRVCLPLYLHCMNDSLREKPFSLFMLLG
jgi:hypothetical protein